MTRLTFGVLMTCAILLALGVMTSSAHAELYSTDFENFALGGDTTSGTTPLITDPALSSNNWRGDGYSGLADNGVENSSYDGEIVNTGSPNGKAYRLSNAKVSGNYDITHASTPTVGLVGESSTTAGWSTFNFSVDFKAAVDGLQDGLVIDVTPNTAGTANRQGILYITDDETNGFSVWWSQFDNGSYENVELATGLSRADWHSIEVTMDFVDGESNDLVSIDLNSSSTTGLTTWESASFYSSAVAVDSVVFRAVNPIDTGNNTGGVSALDGDGVLFDNLTVSAVPEPATMGLLALGGLALLRRRRRTVA